MPAISNPCPSSRATQSTPNRRGQGLLKVLGHDRCDGADVLVVAVGVRCPPFAVRHGPGGVGDLGVDVQLHVAVPGGVLQPVRHRQLGLVNCPVSRPSTLLAWEPVRVYPASRWKYSNPACTAFQIIWSTSPTRPDQYSSPSLSPACQATRAFSPSEAWKIEIDLENEIVRSKYSGLCRARAAASIRSSRLRSAVACGSAASSRAYRSAAFCPPDGGPPSRVPSGALRPRSAP